MFYVVRHIFLLFKVNLKLSASFQWISRRFYHDDYDDHLNKVNLITCGHECSSNIIKFKEKIKFKSELKY